MINFCILISVLRKYVCEKGPFFHIIVDPCRVCHEFGNHWSTQINIEFVTRFKTRNHLMMKIMYSRGNSTLHSIPYFNHVSKTAIIHNPVNPLDGALHPFDLFATIFEEYSYIFPKGF